MENKKIFVTIDFEDWFHLPYLKKYGFKNEDYISYCEQTISFFKYLKEKNIVATVFVVGDIAKDNADLIKAIDNMGHEIACHSLHHQSVNTQTSEEFEKQTREAKKTIETIVGHEIYGFRAPSFSMEIDKLLILKKIGFKYDASYINSKANEYYNVMDISQFEKVDSLVYKYKEIFEFETPTFKLSRKRLPFAGGGFFRLYPLFVFKTIFNKFSKTENNFMFFIHPYEIVGSKFGGTCKLNFKDKIRINLHRKKALEKAKKAINFVIKKGYEPLRFIDYCDEHK